jgi:hypothetical protein
MLSRYGSMKVLYYIMAELWRIYGGFMAGGGL